MLSLGVHVIDNVKVEEFPFEIEWTYQPLQFVHELSMTVYFPDSYPATRWKQARIRSELDVLMKTYNYSIEQAKEFLRPTVAKIKATLTKDYSSEDFNKMHLYVVEQCHIRDKLTKNSIEKHQNDEELEEIQARMDRLLWAKTDTTDMKEMNDELERVRKQKDKLYEIKKNLLKQEEDLRQWDYGNRTESSMLSSDYYRTRHHVIKLLSFHIMEHPILFEGEKMILNYLYQQILTQIVKEYETKESSLCKENLVFRMDINQLYSTSHKKLVAQTGWKQHEMYYEKIVEK